MFWLKINLFLAKLKVMTIFWAENTNLLKDKKSIQSVLVTTYGLKRNDSASRFDCVVTLEDLFQR